MPRTRQPKRDTTLFMPSDPRQGDRVVKAYTGGEREAFVFLDGVWAMETSPFEDVEVLEILGGRTG